MTLSTRLRKQAQQCGLHGSPLTAALLDGAADDLDAGGVVADLLGPHAGEPAGDVLPLRFAGALHRLVLERAAPELALHYPSVGGTAPVAEVWPAAERAVRASLPRLRELVGHPVQTNEVGRAAVLVGVLQQLHAAHGLPVRLLELGASAGLNLRADAYAYEVADGVVLGDRASPVRLRRPWAGTPPSYDEGVHVVDRLGCDPSPLDAATTEGRLRLTSYVWADQLDRLERLRGALEVAARLPAAVEPLGALAFLRRELAAPGAGVLTLVWHSVVWQYVDPRERREVDRLLAEVGVRRGADAPLVRASMEPERLEGGTFAFRVHVQTWPGGERVHVADCLGHGPPVTWLP